MARVTPGPGIARRVARWASAFARATAGRVRMVGLQLAASARAVFSASIRGYIALESSLANQLVAALEFIWTVRQAIFILAVPVSLTAIAVYFNRWWLWLPPVFAWLMVIIGIVDASHSTAPPFRCLGLPTWCSKISFGDIQNLIQDRLPLHLSFPHLEDRSPSNPLGEERDPRTGANSSRMSLRLESQGTNRVVHPHPTTAKAKHNALRFQSLSLFRLHCQAAAPRRNHRGLPRQRTIPSRFLRPVQAPCILPKSSGGSAQVRNGTI